MATHPKELREYVTARGVNPFRKWLRSLRNKGDRARVRTRLNRLRLGNFGDCKSLGDGVFEMRLHTGPGLRIYFGREERTIVLLLHGGDKSSQDRDIKRAKNYWKDYQRRTS